MAEFNKIPATETIKGKETKPEISRAALITENKTAEFIVKGFALQRLQTKFFSVEKGRTDTAVSKGDFGLNVFSNLEILGGSYLFFNDELQETQVNFYDGLILDTVLMTVTMAKNIITTQIQGRNGTVKEYISDGDFEIDVRGVLVGKYADEYPKADVETLINILTVPDTLTITSEFLSRFNSVSPKGIEGIDKVVITDFNLPQTEGSRNMQLFQFKMLSNTPIELTE